MREFNYEIMDEIKKRWSPRAFSGEVLTKDEIMPIFEAARYAPSAYNEQPWRFIFGVEKDEREKLFSFLLAGNQAWAEKASALVLIISKKNFSHNGKENLWHVFDSGTAWGMLTLEAERRGLITHGMAGFNPEKARKELNIPEEYDLIAMVAVGKYGKKDELPESYQKIEEPGTRKELGEIVLSVDSFI